MGVDDDVAAAVAAEAGFLAPFFLDARGSEGAEPEAGPVPREADLRHPLAPVPLPHSSVCSALLVLLLYTLCFASSSSALNPSALLCSVCSEYGVCSAFPNIRLLLSFMQHPATWQHVCAAQVYKILAYNALQCVYGVA